MLVIVEGLYLRTRREHYLELRGKGGRAHAPTVLRENYVNMLYAAED